MLVRLLTLLVLVYHVYAVDICDRKPKGATGTPQVTGNRYRIVVASNPESYTPEQQYTVILQGRSSVVEEPNRFNGFTLTVEPAEQPADISVPFGPLAAGIFKIKPHESNTKIDENCPNTVVHSSHTFVSKIEVWWRAPEAGIGCVLFRASVMEQTVWFQNDGGLTLKLCENKDTVPYPQEKCCSCNEAKYEMKFEGLWTRQSHPIHFPDNVWLTRFSDVIGASHAADYRIWKANTSASTGLIEFSENGNTTILESEIKSNRTRTVIKAKGVTYPNITGKTFAVFRVDPEHHLLSLVSLIKPSPDWFVGLTGFELCDANCTWISERKIDLHPYDFGIWDDVNYETRNQPSKEDLIHKIDHSNIPESPFYIDNTEKLKPMARVHLIKSREYERNENCQIEEATRPAEETSTESSLVSIISQDSDTDEEKLKQCTKAQYGDWIGCTAEECDPERVRVKFRQFDESIKDFCLAHNIQPTYEEPCESSCVSWKKKIQPSETMCPVTAWSHFSECKPKVCRRERKRTLRRDEDRSNPLCVNVVKMQLLPCSKEECQQARKKPGSKPPKNKYNVSISASYTYFAEYDTSLCANKTFANNKTG